MIKRVFREETPFSPEVSAGGCDGAFKTALYGRAVWSFAHGDRSGAFRRKGCGCRVQEQIEGWLAKERYTMDDLRGIVALLRDPDDGCPWDKVQTHASIRKNFIEETYEVADAIDLADAHLLCEELGDVLLQVALHTQMEAEQGTFTFDDVCTGICKKLIARHPHIFAQACAPKRTADEVLDTWEQIKRREKHREGLAQDLESVPRSLPALMRAQKVAKRAAGHGVSQPDTRAALQTLAKRVEALQTAAAAGGGAGDLRRLLGEMLFSAADASRFLGCDAEEALSEATGRFIGRFERAGGSDPD